MATTNDDYLHTTRKKRKNYVILATNKDFDFDIKKRISNHIKKNFPHLTVASPTSTDDFLKMFNRQINLIIIDDKFSNLEENIQLIKTLKNKKNDSKVPVFFLTHKINELIGLYSKNLLQHHETDNYIDLTNSSSNLILHYISNFLNKVKTKEKRLYKFNLEVNFFNLSTNESQKGKIIDFTLHGGKILTTNHLFRVNEQIKIFLPINRLMSPEYGDFLRVPAKISKIYISGTKANFKWQAMSEEQYNDITEYLTKSVHQYFLREM